MKYATVISGTFLARPNRFCAQVLIENEVETVHVKNTGRCREILTKGTKVFLEESSNKNRKTRYSLISAYKDDMLINIDSQAPNTVIYEALTGNSPFITHELNLLKREVSFGNSRFDMYFESPGKKGFIEVKGVTLEENGTAMFPDAPTKRGVKHLKELSHAITEGYECYVIFLVQMKGVTHFTPNRRMDFDFAQAVEDAAQKGVNLLAFDSCVSPDEIILGSPVKILL